jgi:hypothetical protein
LFESAPARPMLAPDGSASARRPVEKMARGDGKVICTWMDREEKDGAWQGDGASPPSYMEGTRSPREWTDSSQCSTEGQHECGCGDHPLSNTLIPVRPVGAATRAEPPKIKQKKKKKPTELAWGLSWEPSSWGVWTAVSGLGLEGQSCSGEPGPAQATSRARPDLLQRSASEN